MGNSPRFRNTKNPQRTLTPPDSETCKTTLDPRKTRQTKVRELFFRVRPDGTTHHNNKKNVSSWNSNEHRTFSRTTSKKKMTSKQYENFMNILRKAKNPDWTSEQINFIVGSETINESVMDTNLDKIVINQKNQQKIKVTTGKTNIHSLLNILKPYYAKTQQDKPKLTDTEGTGRVQLTEDTRQTLDKRPPHHQRLPGPHTCTPPPQKRHTERTSSDKHTPPQYSK
jgi:hypothetical protein